MPNSFQRRPRASFVRPHVSAHADLAAANMRIAELEAQLAAARNPSGPRLQPLVEMSTALLTVHEIPPLLRLASAAAVNLFPGAAAALALFPEANALVLQAVNGEFVQPLLFARNRSLFGTAFRTPRPMLALGPELELLLSELSDQEQQNLQDLVPFWPPASAILLPLRLDERRFGCMVVAGGEDAHLFMPRDLPFAQALGNLVAVAVAEVVERERSASLQGALATTRNLHAEAQARLSTAEAQLLQSAKLAAVGELSASIAHEINNPLYAARNSLYLVDQDMEPDSPQRQFLDIAQSELARIARIVSRMRDFYRPSSGELEPVALNSLISETLELVQTHLRRSQIHIEQVLDSNLPMLVGHADQIRQVLLNLMINACDAMTNGGTLKVTSRCLPQMSDANEVIEIVVSDTGTGISDEHLQRIFEPFYTTKTQGTGLGLAISAHIITHHGGRLLVNSALGVGTSFTILLPLAAPGAPTS